jgi:hypothetical protein
MARQPALTHPSKSPVRFLRGLFLLQELIGRNASLFENGSECPFGHIAGMIGNGGVPVAVFVIPDLMTSSGLPIKGEAKRL